MSNQNELIKIDIDAGDDSVAPKVGQFYIHWGEAYKILAVNRTGMCGIGEILSCVLEKQNTYKY